MPVVSPTVSAGQLVQPAHRRRLGRQPRSALLDPGRQHQEHLRRRDGVAQGHGAVCERAPWVPTKAHDWPASLIRRATSAIRSSAWLQTTGRTTSRTDVVGLISGPAPSSLRRGEVGAIRAKLSRCGSAKKVRGSAMRRQRLSSCARTNEPWGSCDSRAMWPTVSPGRSRSTTRPASITSSAPARMTRMWSSRSSARTTVAPAAKYSTSTCVARRARSSGVSASNGGWPLRKSMNSFTQTRDPRSPLVEIFAHEDDRVETAAEQSSPEAGPGIRGDRGHGA